MSRLDTKWRRQFGKDAYWVTWLEVEEYADNPPPGIEKKRWEAKHHIAFNFGLRHNEIDNVDPSKHISYQAVHDTWVCEVVAPKVDKARKIQHIAVKGKWIASRSRCLLFDCVAGVDLAWAGRWPDHLDLTYLRALVGPKANERNQVVTYHSLRHGRVTELAKFYGVSTDALVRFGRWVRASNVNVYNQF